MDNSKALIAVGVIVVLMGLTQPWLWLYATVTVDTTPPTIGEIRVPNTQGTYGDLTKVTLRVKDDTSGVSTVTFMDDHTGKVWALELESGNKFDGVWSKEISESYPKDAWIGFHFKATDWNYNEKAFDGDFMLLNLGGYWEVSDGEAIFRSDAVNWNNVRFRTGDLTFRFHETSGDAASVTVEYTQARGGDATGSVTMTRIDADNFEGSHSFPDGVYNIEMVASDGFNAPITASIIQIGDVSFFSLTQMAVITLGILMVLSGLYIRPN